MDKKELIELMYYYRFISYLRGVNAIDKDLSERILDEYNKYLMISYSEETNSPIGSFEIEDAFTYYNDLIKLDLLNHVLDLELEKLQRPFDIEMFGIKLDFTDPFMLDNFDYIVDILLENEDKFRIKTKMNEHLIERVSHSKTEALIIGFLQEIDPSGTMLVDYLELKKSGGIIDVPLGDEQRLEEFRRTTGIEVADEGYGFYPNDGKPIIKTSRENNCKDFPYFIHEFFHYESTRNSGDIPNILSEYYSTAAELLAIEYASGKTISEKDKEKIMETRIINSGLVLFNSKLLFDLLKKKKNNQEIRLEDFEQDSINKIRIVQESIGPALCAEIKAIQPDYFDVDKTSNETVEKTINSCININGFIKNYPYIVGHILAEETVKKIKSGELKKEDLVSWTLSKDAKQPNEIFGTLTGKTDFVVKEVK